MSTLKKILDSFRIYFKARTREGIMSLVYGGLSGGLLFQMLHTFELIKMDAWVVVLISVFVGSFGFLLDFFIFHFSGHQKIQRQINKLNQVLGNILDTPNVLLRDAAMVRLSRETQHLENLKRNTLKLEALQNYEYIRHVFMRVLTEIMKPGDHYITLSNLDYWTMHPKDVLDRFIIDNDLAVRSEKYIHRLIVLNREKYFSDRSLTDKEQDKKEKLKKVLQELKKEFNIDETNYFDPLKTLCYLVDTKDKKRFDRFLPSVIVLKKNYKDLLLLTVDGDLDELEEKNPNILIHHYSFEKMAISQTKASDVLFVLKEINQAIKQKMDAGDGTPQDNYLYSVLGLYINAYNELGNLYNMSTGKKHKHSNSVNMMDIPMMLASWK